MEKKLKTLSEHNSRSSTFHSVLLQQKPIPNGIACPKCGEELLDTKPNEILTSIPPQKSIRCANKECNFVGYRIA
jgi:uncharacterized protein with PIN domain